MHTQTNRDIEIETENNENVTWYHFAHLPTKNGLIR